MKLSDAERRMERPLGGGGSQASLKDIAGRPCRVFGISDPLENDQGPYIVAAIRTMDTDETLNVLIGSKTVMPALQDFFKAFPDEYLDVQFAKVKPQWARNERWVLEDVDGAIVEDFDLKPGAGAAPTYVSASETAPPF